MTSALPFRPRPNFRYRRPGIFAIDLTGLIMLFGLAIIFFALFIPLLAVARERAKATVCAANLAGVGRGLHTYASDGNQGMPIAAHAKASSPEKGKVKYAPGMIGKKRGESGKPAAGESDENDTELSTTRNLWTLIRMGGSTPGSFICPSSQDQRNDEDNPQDFWDFAKYTEVSYGYQVPYGQLGMPSGEGDPRAALAADKSPYGAALEAKAKNPGIPTPRLDDSTAVWRAWNSPNHRGRGQNVLYADSHVDFVVRPIAGVKFDNIYTAWSNTTGGDDTDPAPRIHGTPPTSNETPRSGTDSLIYP